MYWLRVHTQSDVNIMTPMSPTDHFPRECPWHQKKRALNQRGATASVGVGGVCQYRCVPVDFTALDFETANSHPSSACSVGLVRVRDGVVVDRAHWLISPPPGHAQFLPFNIKIHGITPSMAAGAPVWEDQLADLISFIGDDVAVAHNASFDMGVIRAACAETVSPTPRLKYLCSVQVSRKTYEIPSHRLPLSAAAAGFGEFAHHDALADAEACAAIIIDSAHRHSVDDVLSLAKTTGVRIQQLKAIPLKL